MNSGIVYPGRNSREVQSIKVELFELAGRAMLDYIDVWTTGRSVPIRLRPHVLASGHVVLKQIKVYHGRGHVTGTDGGFPDELKGTFSTKGGPKGDENA